MRLLGAVTAALLVAPAALAAQDVERHGGT